MVSSEYMTCLIDQDVCNGSVQHAWMNDALVSVRWQAVCSFFFTLSVTVGYKLTVNLNPCLFASLHMVLVT